MGESEGRTDERATVILVRCHSRSVPRRLPECWRQRREREGGREGRTNTMTERIFDRLWRGGGEHIRDQISRARSSLQGQARVTLELLETPE